MYFWSNFLRILVNVTKRIGCFTPPLSLFETKDVWLLIFHLDQTLIEKMAEIFDSLLFRINISKSGEILTKLSNLKIFGLKVLNQGKSFENL